MKYNKNQFKIGKNGKLEIRKDAYRNRKMYIKGCEVFEDELVVLKGELYD